MKIIPYVCLIYWAHSYQRGFSADQLSHIFSVANFGNGVVAIVAGIC
jgi:hypothetical protein